jgi:hypothetical protein
VINRQSTIETMSFSTSSDSIESLTSLLNFGVIQEAEFQRRVAHLNVIADSTPTFSINNLSTVKSLNSITIQHSNYIQNTFQLETKPIQKRKWF